MNNFKLLKLLDEFASRSPAHRHFWVHNLWAYPGNTLTISPTKTALPAEISADLQIIVAKARLLGARVEGWNDQN